MRVKVFEGIHQVLKDYNSAEISIQVQYGGEGDVGDEDRGEEGGGEGSDDGGLVKKNGVDEDLKNFKEEVVVTVDGNVGNVEDDKNNNIELKNEVETINNHTKEANTTTTATNSTTSAPTNTTTNTTLITPTNPATPTTTPQTNSSTTPSPTTLTETKWRRCTISLDISLHPCIHAYALHVLPNPTRYVLIHYYYCHCSYSLVIIIFKLYFYSFIIIFS